jgi:FixJ family two-component response regulator
MHNFPIYLIDDDAAVSEALSLLLKTYSLEIVCFHGPQQFLSQIAQLPPGCLLIDLRMPLMSGLQLYETLNASDKAWPAILITGHGDVNACRRAFKHGFIDFLTKPIDEQVLLDALHSGFERLTSVKEKQENHVLLASLTERERMVFNFICQGFATKDIAIKLAISPRTIDAHRARISEKLGTHSVIDFVRLKMHMA